MDRRDTYFRQLVTDGNVDEWFDLVEADANARTAELGFMGVVTGLAVTEHSPNDLTVDVSGGTCFDADGQRIAVSSTQNVDLSVDSNGSSTSVVASGKTKIVSVFLKFDRALSGVTQDGNSNNVYYNRDESFTFYVKQGAETTGTPTAPALEADGVLLADVTLAYSQTQITDSDIDTSTASRRQDMFVLTGTTHTVREGTPEEAMQALQTILDAHITGTADKHTAAVVTTTILGLWANADAADKVAAGTAQSSLEGIVSKLAATTTTHSGAHFLGVASQTGTAGTLAASDLYTRLELLRDATNLYCPARSAWLDSYVNAAAGLYAAVNAIVTDLSAYGATGRGSGADKIGMALVGNFTNVSVSGCFGELVATTNANDGAKRVGAEANGNLTAGTVRSQLDELDTEKAGLALNNVFAGTNEFDAAVTFDGTTDHNAAATFDSTADFNGAVTLDGGVTRTSGETRSGNGAWTALRYRNEGSPGATRTIDIDYDVYEFGSPTLPCTVTVSAGTVAGQVIEVFASGSISNAYTFQDSGVTMFTFDTAGGDDKRYAKIVWDGSNWRVVAIIGPDAATPRATLAATY